MYSDLLNLIENYLDTGFPEQHILENKISKVLGKQVSCSINNDCINVRVHIPFLLRGIASKYLDAEKIENELNKGKYHYKCKEVIGGVSVHILDSPDREISKFQIVV